MLELEESRLHHSIPRMRSLQLKMKLVPQRVHFNNRLRNQNVELVLVYEMHDDLSACGHFSMSGR